MKRKKEYEQHLIKEAMPYHRWQDVVKHYGCSRAQAFRWLKQGYALVKPKLGRDMPAVDFKTIAHRSALYVCARQRDIDLVHEAEQVALIALWKDAKRIGTDENKAYQAGRAAALNALKWWRTRANSLVALDDFLAGYETDGAGDLDMQSGEQTALDGQK